jgi:hypothetical protein
MNIDEYASMEELRRARVACMRTLQRGGRAKAFWAAKRASQRLAFELFEALVEEAGSPSEADDLDAYCQHTYGKRATKVMNERMAQCDPLREWKDTPEHKAFLDLLVVSMMIEGGAHPEPTIEDDGTVETRWFFDTEHEEG